MHKLLFAALALSGLAAIAQDNTQPLRESNVVWHSTIVRPAGDGGCMVEVYGQGNHDAGFAVPAYAGPLALGGARCSTVTDMSMRALKRELKVGDGGAP